MTQGTAALAGSALTQTPQSPIRTPGYQATFVDAYERHYSRVFAFVYSRVSEVETARDLTSDVFEKAFRKGHTVRDPDSYVSWLFTVARNVVIGHYRRSQRETNGMEKVKESLWLQDGPAGPEDGALQGEEIRDLMERFRMLSERDRELLALKFDGDLS